MIIMYAITFENLEIENKKSKTKIQFYIKENEFHNFYNLKHYIAKEIYSSPVIHFVADGTTFDEQWISIPLEKDTFIKEEIVIFDKSKNRNKKYIKYFQVEKSQNTDFNFGIYGNVKEIGVLPKDLNNKKTK